MDLNLELLIALVVLGSLGGLVSLVRLIAEKPMRSRHFGIGLGIALLLPLSVDYAVELVRPSPKEETYQTQLQSLENRRVASKSAVEKKDLEGRKKTLTREHDQAKKAHGKVMFTVGYPVGMAAIILGILTSVLAVSPGLLFGGLLTLSYACFSYWDTMADWLRFVSLLGALFILVFLGGWRCSRDDQVVAAKPPGAFDEVSSREKPSAEPS